MTGTRYILLSLLYIVRFGDGLALEFDDALQFNIIKF